MRLRGLAPTQALEAIVLTIDGNPGASRLDRKRRKPRVLNQIARGFRFPAEIAEDCPMLWTGLDDYTVWQH
jgi:hypothetical protein